ncbi:hypothetical protein PAHAL_3G495600 [Panicum hallii]|uniref:Uncharacterized protein n=1 Tax=Panicum hallii TaxID=206008 RepID=A0A2T8KM27_9POAL|nr:hypothetical protein PAHAL_3G495600 [Panicum hallii]
MAPAMAAPATQLRRARRPQCAPRRSQRSSFRVRLLSTPRQLGRTLLWPSRTADHRTPKRGEKGRRRGRWPMGAPAAAGNGVCGHGPLGAVLQPQGNDVHAGRCWSTGLQMDMEPRGVP